MKRAKVSHDGRFALTHDWMRAAKVLLAAMACTVAACSSGVAATETQTAPPPPQVTLGAGATGSYPAAAWPEFGQNAARTGIAADLPAAGPLSQRWTAHLDGAVYGQPLVVGDTVIAATENDSVYALNASTGGVVWRHHLGTPVPRSSLQCGDIDPLGITGTPVYDQDNGLVYAVGETTGYHHVLFGLAVSDGAIRVQRDIAVATDGQPPVQRPAAARAGHRRPGGSTWRSAGWPATATVHRLVVGVPLSGGGPLVSWHTPTSREGAIWATGRARHRAGRRPVGVHGERGGGARPAVRRQRLGHPAHPGPGPRLGFFAPAVWADDNANDLDLGSTQPVLAAGNAVFIMGKRGVGYLLDADDPGGIGGQLAEKSICAAFGAAAVDRDTIYEPCSGGGMAAIAVNAASRTINVLWRGPSDAAGSPVVGGGAVWVTRYSDTDGTLYELDPATGAVRQQIAIDDGLPHFSSLSLAGGTAFVATLHGVVAIKGA